MTTLALMRACALRYAQAYGWYVFPVATPLFDDQAHCVGCSCEKYRRSIKCQQKTPQYYLGSDGKCANPGKCPRVRWSEKSTIDPAQIQHWWGCWWEDANVETGRLVASVPNVGIDCGKSGLLVFDADTYKDEHGDLTDLLSWDDRQTITSLTGGGGEHLLYNRQDKPYGNATKGLPPGIDIRGAGGYIVAPPSLHKSGRMYQFESGYGPRDIPLAPIPAALDAILAAATPKRRADGVCLVTPAMLRRSVRAVERLLEDADIGHSGQMAYGDGFRWILDQCPFNPDDDKHGEDASAFIVVLPDGRIGAGCHHNRCQKRIEQAGKSGWALLCDLVGYQRPERRAVVVEVAL
jgi:hypothetical protein